jgi:hypothetical protein
VHSRNPPINFTFGGKIICSSAHAWLNANLSNFRSFWQFEKSKLTRLVQLSNSPIIFTFGGKIIKLCGNHDFNNLFCFDAYDLHNIKNYVNKRDYTKQVACVACTRPKN